MTGDSQSWLDYGPCFDSAQAQYMSVDDVNPVLHAELVPLQSGVQAPEFVSSGLHSTAPQIAPGKSRGQPLNW